MRAPDRWLGARVLCCAGLLMLQGMAAKAGPADARMPATLQAMAETGFDADALIGRMADIYGDVRVRNRWEAHGEADTHYAPFGSAQLDLDLRVDGRGVAAAGCDRYGPDDHDVLKESYRDDASRFGVAVRQPLAQGMAQRVLCYIHVWDGDVPAAVAERDAVFWGETTIGAFGVDGLQRTAVNAALQGSGEPWAMTIGRDRGADIPAMLIRFIYDVPAAPS